MPEENQKIRPGRSGDGRGAALDAVLAAADEDMLSAISDGLHLDKGLARILRDLGGSPATRPGIQAPAHPEEHRGRPDATISRNPFPPTRTRGSGAAPIKVAVLIHSVNEPDEAVAPAAETGYRVPTACAAAGITYRQLDYWARTGLVEPSVRAASGSGSQRLYGFRDILALKIVKRLLDAGISLQQIRIAVAYLREQGTSELTQVTLMSDGATVYACTSADEVVDLLQGGQGVFGIALGQLWREVEGHLGAQPAAGAEGGFVAGDDRPDRRGEASGGIA